MGIFKRLAGMITGGGGGGNEGRYLTIYLLSNRCREPLIAQVDLFNEVSRADGEDGFYIRKVIRTSGAKRCFDQVELELWLDKKHREIDAAVQGGRRLSEAEYAVELARFEAPEEETEGVEEESGKE